MDNFTLSERKKTFEQMAETCASRSKQLRAKTHAAVGSVILVSADERLHLCADGHCNVNVAPISCKQLTAREKKSNKYLKRARRMETSALRPTQTQVKVWFQSTCMKLKKLQWDGCALADGPWLRAHGDPLNSCPSAGATSPVHLPSSSCTLDSKGARLQMF